MNFPDENPSAAEDLGEITLRARRPSSRYVGVYLHMHEGPNGHRWTASIKIDGKVREQRMAIDLKREMQMTALCVFRFR